MKLPVMTLPHDPDLDLKVMEFNVLYHMDFINDPEPRRFERDDFAVFLQDETRTGNDITEAIALSRVGSLLTSTYLKKKIDPDLIVMFIRCSDGYEGFLIVEPYEDTSI